MPVKSRALQIVSFVLRKETFIIIIVAALLIQVRFSYVRRKRTLEDSTNNELPLTPVIPPFEEETHTPERTDAYWASIEGTRVFYPSKDIEDRWGKDEYSIRLLFLQSKSSQESHEDRWFRQIYETAVKNSKLEVVGLWGEGWPEWDSAKDVAENIKAKFGRVDAVHVHELHEAPRRGVVSDVNSGFYQELQCPDGISHCKEPKIFKNLDMGFLAYANTGIFVLPYIEGKLFLHLPHAAPKEQFYAAADSKDRSIDVLLAGQTGKNFPLMDKLRGMAKSGSIPGTLKEQTVPSKFANSTDAEQSEDYADDLKKAKIAVVTSSVRRFALHRYVEAALAGTLIVGDLPAERTYEFDQFVVQIPSDATADQVKSLLELYLNNEKLRVEKASIGQKIATELYTSEKFVENMIEGWKSYLLKGQRGFHFGQPFNLTRPWCFPGGNTPEWACGM